MSVHNEEPKSAEFILNPKDSRPVMVTGGAGFIGGHLVERLLQEGFNVVVLDDCSTGSLKNLCRVERHPRLKVRLGKVSEEKELERLVREAQSVIHLAAAVGVDLVVKSPIRTIHTNLRETEVLLSASEVNRTAFLLASTSEVYGKSLRAEFAEDDDLIIGPPHLGRWSYACSKLMDEFLAMAYMREKNLPVAIVRFFNTVGPRQTGEFGMVIPRFIQSALAGAPIRVFGDGSQSRCFCHVLDTVEAVYRLATLPGVVGQVINVGGTEEITILGLARKVIETLKSTSQVEFVPYAQAYSVGFEDMQRRKPEISKLVSLTGFRPSRGLEEIIMSTAKWLESD